MKGTKSIIKTDIIKANTNPGMFEDKRKDISPQQQLDIISLAYINSNDSKYTMVEMEAKFGTRGIKPLTKLDYDNVVKKLKASGWETSKSEGSHLLRIQPEFIDMRTGQFKTSGDFERFRIEIEGINYIQDYCKTNSIDFLSKKNSNCVKINKKTPFKIDENENKDIKNTIPSANFDDFNFRVSLNSENSVSKTSKIGVDVFENWNKSKKVFRYLNRVTFNHKDYDFKIDLSIVKSSTKNDRGWMIQTYNIEESKVFNNIPETNFNNIQIFVLFIFFSCYM